MIAIRFTYYYQFWIFFRNSFFQTCLSIKMSPFPYIRRKPRINWLFRYVWIGNFFGNNVDWKHKNQLEYLRSWKKITPYRLKKRFKKGEDFISCSKNKKQWLNDEINMQVKGKGYPEIQGRLDWHEYLFSFFPKSGREPDRITGKLIHLNIWLKPYITFGQVNRLSGNISLGNINFKHY